jgi:hypothetical protein
MSDLVPAQQSAPVAAAVPELVLETLLGGGDLGKLTPAQRADYLVALCQSLGLNPLSRPIEFLTLSGRTVPYAKRDCADQLRRLRGVSLAVVNQNVADGVLTITVRAKTPDGRVDEDVGSVVIAGLKGDALANAHMKCLTKAKRRVTLSICGLGLLDESELDTVRVDAPRSMKPAPRRAAARDAADADEAGPSQVDLFLEAIERADTREALAHIGHDLATRSGELQDSVRPAYAARLEALKDSPVAHGSGE